MPEYLDIPAVAELLGVSAATVRSYSSRAHQDDRPNPHPFPEPAIRLSGSPGWNREDVLIWRDQRPGRGKGPRPNRRVDALGRLAAMRQRAHDDREQFDELSAYDLGRVLGDLTAETVLQHLRRGKIPLNYRVVEVHQGRTYASFRYTDVERWLRSDPPSLA